SYSLPSNRFTGMGKMVSPPRSGLVGRIAAPPLGTLRLGAQRLTGRHRTPPRRLTRPSPARGDVAALKRALYGGNDCSGSPQTSRAISAPGGFRPVVHRHVLFPFAAGEPTGPVRAAAYPSCLPPPSR